MWISAQTSRSGRPERVRLGGRWAADKFEPGPPGGRICISYVCMRYWMDLCGFSKLRVGGVATYTDNRKNSVSPALGPRIEYLRLLDNTHSKRGGSNSSYCRPTQAYEAPERSALADEDIQKSRRVYAFDDRGPRPARALSGLSMPLVRRSSRSPLYTLAHTGLLLGGVLGSWSNLLVSNRTVRPIVI